jgi:hypothetical protein
MYNHTYTPNENRPPAIVLTEKYMLSADHRMVIKNAVSSLGIRIVERQCTCRVSGFRGFGV